MIFLISLLEDSFIFASSFLFLVQFCGLMAGLEICAHVLHKSSSSPSWKDILESPSDLSVPHFLWQDEGKSMRVKVLDEVHDVGLRERENAIVAQFLCKIPNYNAFQKSVKLMWEYERSNFGKRTVANSRSILNCKEMGC